MKLIFDDDFISDVEDNIELFDPICELINKCQSSNCSVADAGSLVIYKTSGEIQIEIWQKTKITKRHGIE